jgi:hypothetical protein
MPDNGNQANVRQVRLVCSVSLDGGMREFGIRAESVASFFLKTLSFPSVFLEFFSSAEIARRFKKAYVN